jgi:hypothetical protein
MQEILSALSFVCSFFAFIYGATEGTSSPGSVPKRLSIVELQFVAGQRRDAPFPRLARFSLSGLVGMMTTRDMDWRPKVCSVCRLAPNVMVQYRRAAFEGVV